MPVTKIESIEQFNSTIQSDKLVLVDFYADWCPPCRRFAPTLEAISNEFSDVLVVAKLNVDELREVSNEQRGSERRLPSFIFYKYGKKVDMCTGANETKVRDMILKHK